MKRLVAPLLCLLTVVAGAAPVAAQDDEVVFGEMEVLSSETRDSGLVEFTVAVPGQLAGQDLPPTAFAVIVDNVPKPLIVDKLPTDDLDVILAIDISGSMRGEPLQAAKDAAASFVRSLPVGVRVGVVSFDEVASVVAPLGSTADQVVTAVGSLAEDGGDTAMYDGVATALDELGRPSGARRAVVLLTDGGDTASQRTLDAVSRRLGNAQADVFAVSLETAESDRAALETLVAPTDGRVVTATDTAELTSLYNSIAGLLGSQYKVTFDPVTAEGGTAGIYLNYLGVAAVTTVDFDPPPSVTRPVRPGGAQSSTDGEAAASPIRTSVVDAPALSGDGARLLGVGLLVGALALLSVLLLWPSERQVRLATTRDRLRNTGPAVEGARERATDFTERLLEQSGRGRLVGSALERAGLDLRPAEFVLMAVTAAVAVAMIGFLFGGPLVAIVLLALTLGGARFLVSYLVARRREQFENQLPSTLQLLAGSLRAGYALPQAAELLGRETASPTADEFHRLTTEHRLGRDFGESLRAMADRVRVDDFDWVVQAIEIHREVGGDLAEVLDNVNATIRDRNYIRRQFSALSAEGRYSAYLIVALPFVVLGLTSVTNPDYSGVLYEEPRGRMVLFVAFMCIVIGAEWMRRLIKVRY